MSSTNEMACKVACLSSSHWNRALTDRMNSTGETGDPCGRPAWIVWVWPVLPSITSIARRSDKNESTQRIIFPAMPTCVIRFSSCLLSTLSKAPLTSRSSARAVRFLAQVFSTLATSCATASNVLLPWRQPDCPLWKTSLSSQKEAIQVATTFSTTLPKQLRRLMTRYALAIVYVGLPCLRNSIPLAVFQV